MVCGLYGKRGLRDENGISRTSRLSVRVYILYTWRSPRAPVWRVYNNNTVAAGESGLRRTPSPEVFVTTYYHIHIYIIMCMYANGTYTSRTKYIIYTYIIYVYVYVYISIRFITFHECSRYCYFSTNGSSKIVYFFFNNQSLPAAAT